MVMANDLARTLQDILERRIPRELRKSVTASLMTFEQRYNNAVSDWKGKPRFNRELIVEKDRITGRIKVSGSDDVKLHWLWTDKGTKPHIIRAKNAPLLVFQTNYSPRTAPIAKAQAGTGKASGEWRATLEVSHPGTEARQFTTTWVQQQTPVLLKSLRQGITTAVRR